MPFGSKKMPRRTFNAQRVVSHFDELTKNAIEVQKQTLTKILEANGHAEYLQRYKYNARAGDDLEERFKAHFPLVNHSDIEPYIRRIVDGDTSPILTANPITAMSMSSGTTQGKPKYLPFNNELARISMQIFRTSFAFRERHIPVGKGKALQFIYSSRVSTSSGGVTITTGTTNLYRSELFRTTMADISSDCTSPPEVIFGESFQQSLYCHLLCGLLQSSSVGVISSAFAHSIVVSLRALEYLWPELCRDIRHGNLSDRITSPAMRGALSKLLSKPDPNLADAIAAKCMGLTNWYGVIPALWPECKYVYGIMTGSMEPYYQKLKQYAGSVPIVCADYGASEGWVGVVTDPMASPEETTFSVVPNVAYFEFLPVEINDPYPVGIGEVQIGCDYEVVLTTFTGLYRYRLGDVVRVTGFYNSTPKLKFLYRRSLGLSITIDKNTEKDLQISVCEAAKLVAANKREVIDFTGYAEVSDEPGRYVVFWELSGEVDSEVLLACADCIDRSFVDVGYVGSRRAGAIGALELRVVRKGTFHRVMEHYLGMGAAVSQFKMPRCISPSNVNVFQILNDAVVGNYFSTAYDV